MRLYVDGVPKRTSMSGFVIAGMVYDDNDQEIPVIVSFDYSPAERPQGNPDKPNPGPGRDAGVDITEVTRKDGGGKYDPATIEFDAADFFDAVEELSNTSVGWNRRMAGV
jgi:hypothetical protein